VPVTAPSTTLSAFAEATRNALQDVLSQALSPGWKAEAGPPETSPVAPESSACIGLLVTGIISGQAALLLSRTDAAWLGRAFVGDTSEAPADYGAEQREAVEELARQVFGLATTALQATFGQLWIGVDPAVSVAQPSQRSVFLLTSTSRPSPVVCELWVSTELANSFAAADQRPAEAADESPGLSRTPTAIESQEGTGDFRLLAGVEVEITLRFGHRWLPLREIVNLTPGSVVELEESVAELVEVIVSDRVLARGEIVSVDGCYAVRITETPQPHRVPARTR